MRLEAFYIHEHFLFEGPQIINFGGEFVYNIEGDGSISQASNVSYIEGFYSDGDIELLSTIVGKNGTGKTSLLYEIAELVNVANNPFDHLVNVAFFNDGGVIVVVNPATDLVLNFDNIPNHFPHGNLSIKPVYYSPYLDFKDSIDGIDLSFDAVIASDLEDVNGLEQGTVDADPYRRLKLANSLRILELMNSDLWDSIASQFKIPSIEGHDINFTRVKIAIHSESDSIDYHNTPNGFRDWLTAIYSKIKEELQNIRESEYTPFSDGQKELYKRYILQDTLFLLISKMEYENDFLNEGKVYGELDSSKSAMELLFTFLENHKINKYQGNIPRLPINETKELLLKIFQIIDEANANNFSWEEKRITLNKEKIIELLGLQQRFMSVVDGYYGTIDNDGVVTMSGGRRLPELVNFQLSRRRLSSGETSLLNLFSKLFGYFDKQILDIQKEAKMQNYLFLLDEPDLGFHPEWKRLFVKTLVSFMERLATKLEASFQIVLTTHDPLTLSDMINSNVIYLNKGITDDSGTFIESYIERKTLTFGANIHDLLGDSFFMEGGFMGEFARGKINGIYNMLKSNDLNVSNEELKNQIEKVIDLIGEPIICKNLVELFNRKYVDNEFKIRQLSNEISRLEAMKDKLTGDRDA